MRFEHKVVLITGASSGIGAETAVRYATEGAHLCITGRNVERLQQVAEKCKAAFPNIKVVEISADISRTEECEKIFSVFSNHFKRLDVLVNNAAVFPQKRLEESTMEEFDMVFKVNLKAVIYLTQMAIPFLRESKGNIVNISSSTSSKPFVHRILYATSKAALDYFTATSALELSSYGIRVNSVNPGIVDTPAHTKESLEQIRPAIPLSKIMTVGEVAEAILYISSDAASSATGSHLVVDAGFCIN